MAITIAAKASPQPTTAKTAATNKKSTTTVTTTIATYCMYLKNLIIIAEVI